MGRRKRRIVFVIGVAIWAEGEEGCEAEEGGWVDARRDKGDWVGGYYRLEIIGVAMRTWRWIGGESESVRENRGRTKDEYLPLETQED
jgi:hypothetical protein